MFFKKKNINDIKKSKIKIFLEKMRSMREAKIDNKNKIKESRLSSKIKEIEFKNSPISIGKNKLKIKELDQKFYGSNNDINKNLYNDKIKFDLFKRNNKKKKRINWKLSFYEFPVKMTQEISRIHWVKKDNLSKKFLITIIFVFIFAIFYFLLDQLFRYVLSITNIIV